jgi:hypothetical protein
MSYQRRKTTSRDWRAELARLRSRYDDGAVSPAIYAVIRKLEADIAWQEHQEAK